MGEFLDALERTPLDHPDMVVLRARAVEELRSMARALQPFADGVFWDNGDVTVSHTGTYDDYVRAYQVLRGGRGMLRLDTGGGCLGIVLLSVLLFYGTVWLLFCSFGRCM